MLHQIHGIKLIKKTADHFPTQDINWMQGVFIKDRNVASNWAFAFIRLVCQNDALLAILMPA
jgi:hypothetical protein